MKEPTNRSHPILALMTQVAVVLVASCSDRCCAVESGLCRPVGVVVAALVVVIVAVLVAVLVAAMTLVAVVLQGGTES